MIFVLKWIYSAFIFQSKKAQRTRRKEGSDQASGEMQHQFSKNNLDVHILSSNVILTN